MVKGGQLALIILVLVISAIGYFSQVINKGADVSFSVLYMLVLLALYVVLKDVKLQ